MSMSRAARRRAVRARRKAEKRGELPPSNGEIILKNPVAGQFGSFIFGNSTHCDRVAEEGSASGQTLVLCGAGPSLADEAAEWCPKGDQVWGCNSALTWLADNGHNPTHGFTVDQTPAMVREWWHAPDVEYLLASSAHPNLTEHLLAAGRRLTWFHNYVGITDKPPVEWETDEGERVVLPYEDWLYWYLYPSTIRAGSGLNSVNRALDVAGFMGFGRIIVLGADCALRCTAPPPDGALPGDPAHTAWLEEHTVMHADGGTALASGATAVTMSGEIDGRRWESKPDMLVSAVWLVMQARNSHGVIEFKGDTLPVALADKPLEYLRRLPNLTGRDGMPMLPDLKRET
jgi:hypothetical protein